MKLIAVCVVVAVCFAFTGEAAQTTLRPKTTNSIVTTKKPSVASNSFKICRDTNTTATSGSVQPLSGLAPIAGSPRTCNFSIIAPPDQRVQLYCSVANLSTLTFYPTLFGGDQTITSYSLTFTETVDIFLVGDSIVPNRIYFSRSNTFSMTYRVVNAADTFNCTWTTIKTPATTDFRWCRDGQTSLTNATIQTFSRTENSKSEIRLCPFSITSSVNRQVQMSCSSTNSTTSNGLMTFDGAASTAEWMWRPEVNRATANGNRIDLLTFYVGDDRLNCKWTTVNTPTTTKASNFDFCLHGLSTASNGTFQPMANLVLGSGESRWCLFSIIAPADKRIQVSCSVVNMTSNTGVYNYLMFDGVSDSPFNADKSKLLPTLNRVYTSIKNRIDVTTLYVNGDKFYCNWNTVEILAATSKFTFCVDGEATVTNGTIQSSTSTSEDRRCRFTITAPQTKRVQFSCSLTGGLVNKLMEYDEFGNSHTLISGMIVNRNYTSYGNQLLLYATVKKTLQLNCKWIFV